MKKLALAMAAVLALLSIAGCGTYVGKGKAPPPVVTKGEVAYMRIAEGPGPCAGSLFSSPRSTKWLLVSKFDHFSTRQQANYPNLWNNRALLIVVVLGPHTPIFHRISHLTNCNDRKKGHPPLLLGVRV
jgi:hypothetical protein